MQHAEAAAISRAARDGLSCNGATMAITHEPCSTCARLIVDAGITSVVLHSAPVDMGWDTEDLEAAKEILESGAVGIFRINLNPELLPSLLTRGEKRKPCNKKGYEDGYPSSYP
jgi:deoxycytidylate deaminase